MKQSILTLILALFMFSGCKTTQDVQYVDRDVVRYVDRLVKDSVHIYNTDTVKIQQKGGHGLLHRYKMENRISGQNKT